MDPELTKLAKDEEENLKTVTINWSDEDNCYVAKAPSVPGCIGTGDTVEEAKEDFEAAKLEWTDEAERLASARSEGRKDV